MRSPQRGAPNSATPLVKPYFVEAPGTGPVENLALEAALLEQVGEGECILYLWQNQCTVVIGRNQNCRRECRLQLLEGDGGTLVRRLSGGGAVYHDLGNLNFTFLAREPVFHVAKQLSVILQAVQSLGINAQVSGRNDLTIQGRKFSGNAFYQMGERRYHHGTILVDVDGGKLGRYLNVSPEKLRSKGVQSVQSRVCCLREFSPQVTVADVKGAVLRAFGKVYGAEPAPLPRLPEPARLSYWKEKFASHEWRFGREPAASFTLSRRFPWGGAEVLLTIKGGAVTGAKVYTDAMDAELPALVETALMGKAFSPQGLGAALRALPAEGARRLQLEDLAGALEEMEV